MSEHLHPGDESFNVLRRCSRDRDLVFRAARRGSQVMQLDREHPGIRACQSLQETELGGTSVRSQAQSKGL